MAPQTGVQLLSGCTEGLLGGIVFHLRALIFFFENQGLVRELWSTRNVFASEENEVTPLW